MYLCSNSEVYYGVLLKYKQSTFLCFSAFVLCLYFFLGNPLKAYFNWTSRIWSINEAYLKYEHFGEGKKSHIYQHLMSSTDYLDKCSKDCFSVLDIYHQNQASIKNKGIPMHHMTEAHFK